MNDTPQSPDTSRNKLLENDSPHSCYKKIGEAFQENPLPIIIGALLIGAILGMIFSKQEENPQRTFREWLDNALDQVTDKLAKKKNSLPFVHHEPTVFEHLKQLRRHLKRW